MPDSTLASFWQHPRSRELILHLCRLHLAALADYGFQFSEHASTFGMASDRGVFGTVFEAIIRRFSSQTSTSLTAVAVAGKLVYQFGWQQQETRRVGRTVLEIALEWNVEVKRSERDIIANHWEQLRQLNGIAFDKDSVMHRLIANHLKPIVFLRPILFWSSGRYQFCGIGPSQPILKQILSGFPFFYELHLERNSTSIGMKEGTAVFASRTGVLAVVATTHYDLKLKGKRKKEAVRRTREEVERRAREYRGIVARQAKAALAVVACICVNAERGGVEVVPLGENDRMVMDAARELEALILAGIHRPTRLEEENHWLGYVLIAFAMVVVAVGLAVVVSVVMAVVMP